MTTIYYDMQPDYTVSVYLDGHWDFFASYQNLVSYCEDSYDDFELVSVTNTTLDERLSIMGLDNE